MGYTSSPSEADNVHFCLPFESDDRHRHQYVARKQALNLNVGEPRTVRLIYFLPNDRSFNAEVVQNMKDEIRNIQTFYAEQMQAHGYGNKTFRFETDAQGEPMVHRVDGQHSDSHYGNRLIKEKREIEQIYDLSENVYFVVLDNRIETVGRNVIGRGGREGKNGGIAMVPRGFSFRTAAHELGHAFGLDHDFNSNAYMMSYGSRRDRLSAGHAEYLTVHPYFNSDTSSNTGAGAQGVEPTIELASSTGYPAGSTSASVQLKVSDAEGLHQVILFVDTIEPHPADGFLEVKTYRGLDGEKDAVIEFDYDGVIPSLGYTSLSDSPAHSMYVRVVDTDGNVSSLLFSVFEISPYHIATFGEHKSEVFSIAFSRDGTLASTGNDGTVRLWDIAKEENIATFEMFTATAVAFSPDGKIVVSGASGDIRVRLWDVSTGEIVAVIEGTSGVRSIAFSPDGTLLAFGLGDDTVRLWDVATKENIAILEGHTNDVWSVAFSPDGRILASGSIGETTVRLWDVATKENIATLEGHMYEVRSVAFSPDGRILASGSMDNTVRLWDVATGETIATLGSGYYEFDGIVTSVAFSPDGRILASGSLGNTVKLWDVATRTTIAILNRDYYDSVVSVAFSPDGTRLVSGSWNGEIHLWDTSEWIQTPRPQALVRISGDGQQGTPLSVLTNPYVVEVRDQHGNPVQGAQVTFTVATGDGKLSGRFTVENVTTDANGRAQSTFRLGSIAGTNTVKASIGGPEVIFNATGIETPITPAIGGAYQKWHLPDGAIARLGKGSISGSDRAVAFSSDGQRFAVASDIGVWVYDVATSRELALFTGHTDGVNAIAFSPDGTTIASGSNDRTIKLWDVATGENIAKLEGHWNGVNSVVFSADGTKLASGAWDNTVKVWDVSTRTNISTFEGHTDGVNAIAFSPDGTTIASGSNDNTVRLWDVSTRTNIAALEHGDGVSTVAFSLDGAILASGGNNGIGKLWNVAKTENIATYIYDDFVVRSIAFSPDGATFAVATSSDVKLWDVATGKNVAILEGDTGAGSVAFSSDGTKLAIGSIDDTVKLWEIATENVSVLKHTYGILSVAFAPDSKILATGSEGVIELWDVATGANIATIDEWVWNRSRRLGSINSVTFSPDGTILAGAGSNVHLWDVSTRTYIGRIKGQGTINSVAFSPDGTIAFGFPDGTVKLWDVSTGENIATLEGHTDWPHAVAFSPDGTTIASGSDDQTVKLWDVSTRTNIATLEGHTDNVRSIAFSPDGTKIASGSYDEMVKLWDVSTQTNIATFEGHINWVKFVSFSPDGTVLASAGSGQIRLWDIATKTDVVTLEGHNRIRSVAFSPDGTTLVSGSGDGTALLWDMSAYVSPVVTGVPVGPARSPTADFDGNGTVGVADFLLFATQFGLSRGDAGYDARFDLDGNGSIGISDFLLFADAFGE